MALAALQVAARLNRMSRGAYLLDLGLVPYQEAWDLQRSLAGAVSQGAIPDAVVFLEHPPVVTLGRRSETEELHVPEGARWTSSRRIAAASRPSTGRVSSSATRFSTCAGMART